MTVAQFNQLTSIEKVNTLFDRGKELSSRIYIYYNIKLFVLFDFFVEIWYQQSTNRIERIVILKLEDVLDIYEKDIRIGDLYA
ncbi:MAG: hypothetical protein IPH45_18770 [Bacteroidales bacterium]|nr:hypothetical protein [Bacteroidales bacterium]